jgi:uncharacterized protein (DUF952 family)/chaperonin cofactor prefoldin
METELNVIYHLTPAEYFNNLPADQPYRPREFDRDGFIHCTKGEERLLLVADTVYRRVPGDFLLLVIDERRVTSPVKYENVGGILFPHIYGALNRDAIVRTVAMGRRADGTFLPFGEPDAATEQAVVTEAWLSQARVEQLIAESTELRVRTLERLAQIEKQISNLKSQISKPEAQAPQAAAPAVLAPHIEAAAPVPAPTLETRVTQLEAEVSNLKSQISKLESRTARARPASGKTRKRVARRKSAT